MTNSSGKRDAIELLHAFHEKFLQKFDELEQLVADGDVAKAHSMLSSVREEAEAHEKSEQEVLYPLTAELLDQDAERQIEEQSTSLENEMLELERLAPDTPELPQRLQNLLAEYRSHIQREENEVFPRLRETVDEKELLALGDKLRQRI